MSLFSRIIGVIVTGIFVIIAAFMEMFSNDDLSYSIKLPVKSKIRVNDNDVITITHDNSKYNNNKYLLYKNDVKTSCEAIYTKENVDKEVEENSKLNLTMFSVPFVLLLVLAVLMLVGKHYVIGAVFAVILIIVLITWVLQDKKARKEYENFYSKCKLLFDGIPIKQP